MTVGPRSFASFDRALATAFLEEIAGEAFFSALSRAEPDPRQAAAWAKLALVEQRTTAALRPVTTQLGLTQADEAAAWHSGTDEAADLQALSWGEAMAVMLREYPAYLDEFIALKAAAPTAEVAKSAQMLIDHEIAIIEMARAELAGDPDPCAPLDRYLAGFPA